MEPIHYLRALRRRWWVIAAAVIIGTTAAWLAPAAATSASTSTSSTPKAYTATTVLWNTGAPTIGQGSPITSMEALATLVTLPGVTSIAAKELQFPGTPLALASQVQASVDQTSGFLDITATSPTPKEAVRVSTAFSTALLTYLQRLNVTRIDQQQTLVQQQIQTLEGEGVDPAVIATLRAGLSQLALDRTAPVPITTIQRAVALPLVPPDAAQTSGGGGLQVPKSLTARLILGALLGLLAGIALALILERFDRRIRSAASAEKAFGLPVLAEVPAIARRRRDKVVTATYPYSRAADAFRLVGVGTSRWSANPPSGNGGGNGKGSAPEKPGATTILVTSPEARDGKTTVAANLAVAHAQAGSRVLVVSCDLRRPAIHESFGVAIRPGLTDALQSSNGKLESKAPFDLTPFVEPCSIVRIGVVPSGTTPDRPGELLGSPKMQRLLDRLKRVTDVVILDCAPLVVASDVVPLLPQADGVVLVARAGKTREELASNAATLLERLGARTAGVVLNDAREFSIPLAKRRMYRPTRKMRKAARGRGETTGFDEGAVAGSAMNTEETPPVDEAPTVIAVDEPTVVPAPDATVDPSIDVEVPDVSPTGGDRGSGAGPSIQASVEAPAPWAPPSPPATQLLAPERIVVIPPAEEEDRPVVPPRPELDVPLPPEPPVAAPAPAIDPQPARPSALSGLQQQLVELRKQLEEFQIQGLQLEPPRSNGGNGAGTTARDQEHDRG